VFGRTLNPVNTILTAGGSSGGEGSLIGFRGAPLGIGTDIAGAFSLSASPLLFTDGVEQVLFVYRLFAAVPTVSSPRVRVYLTVVKLTQAGMACLSSSLRQAL
jgi:hypothetical protein